MTSNFSRISDIVWPIKNWNPVTEGGADTFPYIDLSAVDNDRKTVTALREVPCIEAPSRARQIVEADDILVSTVRPNLNGVALLNSAHQGATASTGFCVLRVNRKRADPNYLFQWVKSPNFVADMVRKATGASYPAVSDRIVLASEIPLPSLAEQRRIAAILDQADDLRRKRREAIARLSELTATLFISKFSNSGAFSQKPLSDVCDLITDGTHYTPTYVETGTIFLSAKNVTSGYIDWDNIKYIPETLHQELRKRVSPKRHDVILAKNGTTGVAALVDRDVSFDIYVSLALLRAGRPLLSEFLLAALNSPVCKKQFNSALKGIGVPNLHLKDIRQATIPVPPLDLQRAFVSRIAEIDILKAAHRAHLEKLDALFAMLQHLAFRGELNGNAEPEIIKELA